MDSQAASGNGARGRHGEHSGWFRQGNVATSERRGTGSRTRSAGPSSSSAPRWSSCSSGSGSTAASVRASLHRCARRCFAVIGLGVIAYYRYMADMAREEEGKPWTAQAVAPAVEREVALDIVQARSARSRPSIVLVCGLIARLGRRRERGDRARHRARQLPRRRRDHDARREESGPTAIGAAALGGYILRLGVIVVALLRVAQRSRGSTCRCSASCSSAPTSVSSSWEMKYVSLTLAAPGLRPARPGTSGDQ